MAPNSMPTTQSCARWIHKGGNEAQGRYRAGLPAVMPLILGIPGFLPAYPVNKTQDLLDPGPLEEQHA